ncbi:YfmQ family protein [Alicyclobacillus pomorum]|jgi:Uncharacterised protein from bacillus cereus group|uniref:YfmQ family protein n=1 Tax=Alicyclobacillus pomorum TaxID=204470 RepID=UPI00047AE8FB
MSWWVVLLIFVVFAVIAFVMSPPTYLVDKLVDKFQSHPNLDEDSISNILVNGVAMEGEQRTQFIRGFNEANFLYEGGYDPKNSEGPILVKIEQGGRVLLFSMYLCRGDQVEIVRHKGTKHVSYRVQSADLRKFLSSLRERSNV